MGEKRWLVELIQNDGTWKHDSSYRTYSEAKLRVSLSVHALGRSARLISDDGSGLCVSMVESPARLSNDQRGRFVILIHSMYGWNNLWDDGYYYDNLRVAMGTVLYYTSRGVTLIRLVDCDGNRILFDGTAPKECVDWRAEGF